MSNNPCDNQWMQLALAIGRVHTGQTGPNPSVGCVIVKNNRIIGRGVTSIGGRPHAETQALSMAGDGARGATAYVTLEPCAHHGQTPPCVDALVASGIARVVIATTDPDPRTAGQGIARLRAAGIDVTVGIGRVQAMESHAGFFRRIGCGRPNVTLKIAATRNGYMNVTGRRWITSPAARMHSHLLRAHHDAILVGIGTVLADDPMLNVRLHGHSRHHPARFILDRNLRTPPDCQLVKTARDIPTHIFCSPDAAKADKGRFAEYGVKLIPILNTADNTAAWAGILRYLGTDMQINRLMIEGGFGVAKSLLSSGMADEIHWYRHAVSSAPQISRHDVMTLGVETMPYFLDYSLECLRYFASEEYRIYKKEE